MKTLFVEMRRKFNDKEINLSALDNLSGKTISLASIIQYLDLLPKVKSYLEKKGKKIIIKKGSFHEGQVLGCQSFAFDVRNAPNFRISEHPKIHKKEKQEFFDKNADTLLLLADGKFHARGNALDMEKEIWIFDSYKLDLFSKEEIDKLKERKKKAINKFFMNSKVGLIISTKKGQYFKDWKKIKTKLEKKGKKVYVFETDNISLQELDNFPPNIYINTACPGLSLDSDKIVNLRDILEFL